MENCARLLQSTTFKIILNVLAHGCTENICNRFVPTTTGVEYRAVKTDDYVSNFEKSPYINNINLYSIVPYGINSASGSAETSRESKHVAINAIYKSLDPVARKDRGIRKDANSTNIRIFIENYPGLIGPATFIFSNYINDLPNVNK
jgi:hypothetical protein